MSVSTRTTATVPGTPQFPGNCTMERALEAITNVFHRYSTRQGEVDLLNFNDFKTLLTEQAPTFLEACDRGRRDYLRKLFKETDLNNDKELSFEEFTIVLAKLTDDAHHISHSEDRCTPDKD